MSAITGAEPSPADRPTQVQVLAAKVRMKADRRLNRASPEQIRLIVAADGNDRSGEPRKNKRWKR